MTVLVLGGSGSGKSAYAEKIAMELGKEDARYYLATMQVYDEEGKKKVVRHRELRAGKGFQTIEQPKDIRKVCEKINNPSGEKPTLLLECMSNLLANEMFSGEEPAASKSETTEHIPKAGEGLAEKISSGLAVLSKNAHNLIIVSNNVFEDGICYDADTQEYVRILGDINCRIASQADAVVEVVCGIPVFWKGKDRLTEAGSHL